VATPLHRAADAHQAREKAAGAGLGHDPPPGEHEADASVLRGQADVHRQRHRRPDPHRGAVDGGDHRLGGLEHAQHEAAAAVARHLVLSALRPVVEGLAAGRQVGSGAEAAARAGHDHHAYLVV
jgi:hypothetical protein